MADLCTLVVSGAPLARRAPDIVRSLALSSWTVKVVLTPAARSWVDETELQRIAGEAVRSQHRTPDTPKDQRRSRLVIVAPATFNTVGKLANGIADTLAHSALCEALGEGVPILAVPMVNDRLWGHIAWPANLARLTDAGVHWLNVADGQLGTPQMVQSGTGEQLVDSFDPAWILSAAQAL